MSVRALRAVAGFGLVTGLAMHTLAVLLSGQRAAFFSSNLLAAADRRWLLIFPLASVAAAVVAGAWLVFSARDPGVSALEWAVRLASPVVVAPVFLALSCAGFGTDAETALVLAVTCVAFERLMRVSLAAWAERATHLGERSPQRVPAFLDNPRTASTVVVACTAAHATLMTLWSVWSHQRFGTYGFDLGQYDNEFAATLSGRWLAMPALGLTSNWSGVVSNHADLATFIFLPIYALFPGAKTLLVLQAIVTAGAAIPLYFLAKKRIGSHWSAVGISLAWLAYVPLHCGQLYDFHWQFIGAALVISAFTALEYGRLKLYWVLFAVALLCREDVSIGLTAWGLYLLFSGENVKVGAISALIAVSYFVALRFGVMTNTAFGGMYKDIQAPDEGDGFGAILKTMISNPGFLAKSLLTWDKARYIAQIFVPLAFLPLRRGWLWLLMVPGFFLTVLATGYMPMISIGFQYVANWAGYVFPAAVFALAAFGADSSGLLKRRAALATVAIATVIANLQWGAYSPRGSVHGGFVDVPLKMPTEADLQRERDILELLALVPADAALCTSDRVQPHTTYLHIDNFALRGGVGRCEYLLWPNIPDVGNEHGTAALRNGTYVVVEQRNGNTLAKRK